MIHSEENKRLVIETTKVLLFSDEDFETLIKHIFSNYKKWTDGKSQQGNCDYQREKINHWMELLNLKCKFY